MFRASPPTQKKFQAFPDKRRENVRCKVKGDLQPMPCTRSLLLLCCSAPSRKHPTCLARMQKNGRRDNSLCTEIKSSIEILAVNEKEMTLSGNHVKGGGSYESPSLYMGHVVERCADRSIGRLLQILYVVHVVLIPAFFL